MPNGTSIVLEHQLGADSAGYAGLEECGWWSTAIWYSHHTRADGAGVVTKLKLGSLVDDKPVKLTVELPAQVHRDLVA